MAAKLPPEVTSLVQKLAGKTRELAHILEGHPHANTISAATWKNVTAAAKGEITHATGLKDVLSDIAAVADKAPHIERFAEPTRSIGTKGGIVREKPSRLHEAFRSLQADQLVTEHAVNAALPFHDVPVTGTGYTATHPKLPSKLHTLRDETVTALSQLPGESQIAVMKKMDFSAVDRRRILDPHGALIGNEIGNKTLLSNFADHIHANHAHELPDKGAALKGAIDGAQNKSLAAKMAKERVINLPPHP